MTREEKRAYQREWYRKNREKTLARRRRYVETRGGAAKISKEYRDKNHEKYLETERARFKRINTEEYRAKRRAAYAVKHANDPMTPQRARMIAYFAQREQKWAHEQFYKTLEEGKHET